MHRRCFWEYHMYTAAVARTSPINASRRLINANKTKSSYNMQRIEPETIHLSTSSHTPLFLHSPKGQQARIMVSLESASLPPRYGERATKRFDAFIIHRVKQFYMSRLCRKRDRKPNYESNIWYSFFFVTSNMLMVLDGIEQNSTTSSYNDEKSNSHECMSF